MTAFPKSILTILTMTIMTTITRICKVDVANVRVLHEPDPVIGHFIK